MWFKFAHDTSCFGFLSNLSKKISLIFVSYVRIIKNISQIISHTIISCNFSFIRAISWCWHSIYIYEFDRRNQIHKWRPTSKEEGKLKSSNSVYMYTSVINNQSNSDTFNVSMISSLWNTELLFSNLKHIFE